MNNELVMMKHQQAVTTSRKVAAHFHKRHDNVIRDIENLIAQMASVQESPNLSKPSLNSSNLRRPSQMFIKTTYIEKQNGQTYPMYLMNRDGFTLLAMGFTGKKALQFKLDYINAFNLMEQYILNHSNAEWIDARNDVKLAHKHLHVVLQSLVEYAKQSGSSNSDKIYLIYNRLINKTLGIDSNTRDEQPAYILHEIRKLQKMIEVIVKGLIAKNVDYHQIYQDTKMTLENYSRISLLQPLLH